MSLACDNNNYNNVICVEKLKNMLKIRLKRQGAKRNPLYRVIVIDSREKREGRPVEQVGFYNPRKKELKLDKVKVADWIKKGAQPSETVGYLIKNSDDNGNLIVKKVEEQKLSKKAKAKLEAEAKAKAEAEAKAKEEAEKAKAEAEAKAKEEAEKAAAAAEAPAEAPAPEEEAPAEA
jgi:small subunit ribosomal protein S16